MLLKHYIDYTDNWFTLYIREHVSEDVLMEMDYGIILCYHYTMKFIHYFTDITYKISSQNTSYLIKYYLIYFIQLLIKFFNKVIYYLDEVDNIQVIKKYGNIHKKMIFDNQLISELNKKIVLYPRDGIVHQTDIITDIEYNGNNVSDNILMYIEKYEYCSNKLKDIMYYEGLEYDNHSYLTIYKINPKTKQTVVEEFNIKNNEEKHINFILN